MINVNIAPPKGENWSFAQVQAYYLQQIALLLKSTNRQKTWTSETLEKEQGEHAVTKSALALMLYKDEVIEAFDANETLRFADFRELLMPYKRDIIPWAGREALVQAIGKTDYMTVEPAGRGYRVRLVAADDRQGR